ncbi:MAG: hypothetical protein JWO18_810 [Microbacteriaceae bacterium]|jgi:hypothetical protein|nr:hypothetical protein [Microbacteriaceae bacterium]
MLILIIVLLAVWLILSVVGFAIKGLLWLAIIGIILFVVTAIIGFIRRAARSKTGA